jgi:hypothetical protein
LASAHVMESIHMADITFAENPKVAKGPA